jgi:creatinine amidohydrolase
MPESERRPGYSIFSGTMADATFPEIEELARRHAVVLWGLGVIEEHGPHLPLATDVYIPSAVLDRVRQHLEGRQVPAMIAPPFYWGVNSITAGFAGTITVRPEVMVELMVDVFASFRRDGFEAAFCVSGHGDALHNQTLAAGVKKARLLTGLRAFLVLGALGTFHPERFGLDLAEPHFLRVDSPPLEGRYLDVHAGALEASMMWGCYPDLVRQDICRALPPTNLGWQDLHEWRQGWSYARRKTPQGYFGAPAEADPERGRALIEHQAELITAAIVAQLEKERGSPGGG